MKSFNPHVSSRATSHREFTFKSIILGMILSFVFAIGNAYLGLKVGQTISASIPAAVLSMAFFRLFARKNTILENNIVQTMASVGEGLAGGAIFTIPALYLLGAPPTLSHVALLCFFGGVLGILFMIPMRRYIIVKEHGIIPFPEGTACAEILKAGHASGNNAILALVGVLLGAGYKVCTSITKFFQENVSFLLTRYENTEFQIDCTPALVGVGFIIGPKISALMFAGGAISWWVLIPLIKIFGTGTAQVFPSHQLISAMSAEQIWSSYIRYIGVGTVAIGGILGFIKMIPLVTTTFHIGIKELLGGFKKTKHVKRTDRDISMAYLIIGAVLVILFFWLYPGFPMNFFTVFLLVVLSYLFTAVTSITVGLVGSSSNPVSGMIITIILITCLIFVALRWTTPPFLIAAITMGCVAAVSICLASATSQDLKTGYLLGATPQKQQIAEIIALLLPSIGLGFTLFLLDKAYGFGSPDLPAPQATLMALIGKGILTGQLPLTLISVGVVLGVVLLLLGIPILPFAIGLYLPLSLSTAIMLGGVIKIIVNRASSDPDTEMRGVLLCSGLVAGDALTGILGALLVITGVISTGTAAQFGNTISFIAYLLFALIITLLCLYVKDRNPQTKK